MMILGYHVNMFREYVRNPTYTVLIYIDEPMADITGVVIYAGDMSLIRKTFRKKKDTQT